MRCPFCGELEDKVIETRLSKDNSEIRRRRECEKCVRTMVALRIAGALGRCPTLPDRLDLHQVARQRLPPGPVTTYARESLDDASRQHDWPLALALRASLRPHPVAVLRRPLGRIRRAARRHRRGDGDEPAAVH